MSTITINTKEYPNFVQVCKSFNIKFTQSITKSNIQITAKTDDLVKIGYNN